MIPLLSIVIPTRNRHDYLKEVISILVRLISENLEIVIQDNSDEGSGRESFVNFTRDLNDKRIKYFYFNGHLSINENSDKAVLNSGGKYVTFIGDDDCVVPQIINVVEWMEKESIEILTFHCPSYIWSDVEYKHLNKTHTGVLTYKKPTGRILIRNSGIELERLLRRGGQNLKEMPLLYHGIASRSVLNKIFDVTGSFFPGSVPDMDVAVGLALYSKEFYRIDAPIIIAGTARRSAGGLGAAKLHKGNVREISTLPKDTADTWNPHNPFFWSGSTIYADSIYKCLIRTGNETMLKKFNYNYLYARLLTFNIEYYKEIMSKIWANKNSSLIMILAYLFNLNLVRAKFFVKNRVPYFRFYNDQRFTLQTITEAVEHLEGVVDNLQMPWNNKSR